MRDRRSLENVVELGVPSSRVRLGADEAFSLFPTPPARRDGHGVACVLSAAALVGDHGVAGNDPALTDALVETLELIVRAVAPEPVTIVSTAQGLGGLDRGLEADDGFADGIVARLDPRTRRRIGRVEGYIEPLRCAELIARHRALVSMACTR